MVSESQLCLFADDVVLLASSGDGLQLALGDMLDISEVADWQL